MATAILISSQVGPAQSADATVTRTHHPGPGAVFDSCDRVLRARPGWLVSTTSAGASGSTVAPGQTITITITWDPKDFWETLPFETRDCVQIGFRLSQALSQEHRVDPAAGTDQFSFVVPRDGTAGNQICERATVSGLFARTLTSRILCYIVLGAETPEVPQPLMLPSAALALMGGGGLWVAHRRRQRIRT